MQLVIYSCDLLLVYQQVFMNLILHLADRPDETISDYNGTYNYVYSIAT